MRPDEVGLAAHVRTVADFPRPGITFRDLTPLLANGPAFARAVEALGRDAPGHALVAGIEARGFPFAAALAHRSGLGLVLLRKAGKLPGAVLAHAYGLEYGEDRLELSDGLIPPATRVLLVDDVLATGGTAEAAVSLLRRAGAVVVEARFLMALDGLDGAARLEASGVPVRALLSFPA